MDIIKEIMENIQDSLNSLPRYTEIKSKEHDNSATIQFTARDGQDYKIVIRRG